MKRQERIPKRKNSKFFTKTKFMRSLSLWAKTHPWATRLLIIFLFYPLLNFTGWLIGDLLWELDIQVSKLWYYILATPLLFLLILYPVNRSSNQSCNYVHRKSFDFFLAMLTMAIVMVWGNNLNRIQPEFHLFPVSYANTITNSQFERVEDNTQLKEKNPIKKLLKAVKQKYKFASKKQKTGLIIIAVIVALVLLLGLSALACNIMCSGSEALGLLLLIAGLVLIAYGLARIIQRIKDGPKPKKTETTSS